MSANREAEKKEALGHLVYFKEMLFAQEQAAKRIETNIKLCRKNVQLWESRYERLQPARPKGERGGA